MELCGGRLKRLGKIARQNLLLILIISGVISGFIIGLPLNKHVQSDQYDDEERREIVMLVSFLGDIFVRLLKLLIVPLIIASIVLAVAKLDTKTTGKLGRRTVIYYLGTTLTAVIIGVILVVSIRPGDTAVEHEKKESRHVNALDSILDLLRNLFPDNIVETTFRSASTIYKDKMSSLKNGTENADDIKGDMKKLVNFMENTLYDPWSVNNDTEKVRVITKTTKKVWAKVQKGDRMNVLGIITCSIAFGIALSRLGPEGRQMKNLFEILMKIVMSLVNGVMWLSPIGICSLIAGKLVEMENIGKTFESLAYLIVTTITGIAIQALIVYPTIYFICLRKNPFRYMFNLQAAMFTAFGTDSSAATLPVTIKCVQDVNKVDPRVAQFVLPIGATVNMDGTALYEAVACIYIAQLNGYSFGIGKILITVICSVAASVGAAAIPSAGLVTLLMVLEAAGLPTNDVGLLYSIDWFLDRFRTVCNITGDGVGAAVVEKFSRDDFDDDFDRSMELQDGAAAETFIAKDGVTCTNFGANETKM
ncbi:excitatory amino acid transporter-like [Dendronephthya gigantea]|uniref:excitatory amino acid transporter-like n=1 Tax=Dendronephthya gigantea TaxID=151771 RepID=UPI00106D06C8|nr:excitatory amino acid transporter-like [Dendronephthya gigantea]